MRRRVAMYATVLADGWCVVAWRREASAGAQAAGAATQGKVAGGARAGGRHRDVHVRSRRRSASLSGRDIGRRRPPAGDGDRRLPLGQDVGLRRQQRVGLRGVQWRVPTGCGGAGGAAAPARAGAVGQPAHQAARRVVGRLRAGQRVPRGQDQRGRTRDQRLRAAALPQSVSRRTDVHRPPRQRAHGRWPQRHLSAPGHGLPQGVARHAEADLRDHALDGQLDTTSARSSATSATSSAGSSASTAASTATLAPARSRARTRSGSGTIA